MKKVNDRTDIVSRERFPRETLLRLVIKDDKLILDEEKTLKGRGVYLKKGSGKDAIKRAPSIVTSIVQSAKKKRNSWRSYEPE